MNFIQFFKHIIGCEGGFFKALFSSLFRAGGVRPSRVETMAERQAREERVRKAEAERKRRTPLHEKRKKEMAGQSQLGRAATITSTGTDPMATAPSLVEGQSLLTKNKDKNKSLISGL